MSSNLRAEPVNRSKLELGTALKFALRKRYSEPVNIKMSALDFPFLEGLLAAGDHYLVDDTHKLIEYINKHGLVLIKEEY